MHHVGFTILKHKDKFTFVFILVGNIQKSPCGDFCLFVVLRILNFDWDSESFD
jgi:hypothetical protein